MYMTSSIRVKQENWIAYINRKGSLEMKRQYKKKNGRKIKVTEITFDIVAVFFMLGSYIAYMTGHPTISTTLGAISATCGCVGAWCAVALYL